MNNNIIERISVLIINLTDNELTALFPAEMHDRNKIITFQYIYNEDISNENISDEELMNTIQNSVKYFYTLKYNDSIMSEFITMLREKNEEINDDIINSINKNVLLKNDKRMQCREMTIKYALKLNMINKKEVRHRNKYRNGINFLIYTDNLNLVEGIDYYMSFFKTLA